MAQMMVGDLDIAFERHGPLWAPAVLLLHGWPDSAATWDGVVPALVAAGHQVIVPSLRGFGDSRFVAAAAPRTADSAVLALDQIGLLDALGIDRFAVVGHDWGANIAEALAVGWPARVERIAMLSTPPRLGGVPTPPFRQAQRQWYHWFMATGRGAEAVRADRHGFARLMWDNWSPAGWYSDAEFQATARAFDNPDWPEVTIHSYRARWDEAEPDPRSAWLAARVRETASLSLPALFVHGEQDGVNPPEASAGIERRFTGPFHRVAMTGVGHFPQREKPDQVAQVLLAFLSDRAASAESAPPLTARRAVAAAGLGIGLGGLALAAVAAHRRAADAPASPADPSGDPTMKAVVFHAIGDIRVEQVPEPRIEAPTDAIVRLTASAICGTDLHFVRGTFSGMKKGQVLGHEGVGVVEAVGEGVSAIRVGQRVIIPSTIGCGQCAFCARKLFAQCDRANPGGKRAGTAFFGGPEAAGGYAGLQAEKARVPWADTNLVPIPDALDDDRAILLSDILPTAWFGAELAQIEPGDTVAVFGCGPVGQLAIASAKHMGGRVIAVDRLPDRLAMARAQGVETINFEETDPVEAIVRLTDGDGARRVIDAVGVDAQHAHDGPAAPSLLQRVQQAVEQRTIEPLAHAHGRHFVAGDHPSQALEWAVEAVAKAGTIAIIGVYPPTDRVFPIGQAMNKNVTMRMGNCNHRATYDTLIELVVSGALDPLAVLTQTEPMTGAIEAYKAFDQRQPGWIKVELEPAD